jgi:site-specific recombinase XerD
MLEDHFALPKTADRIRASWIGGAIEQYIAWMEAHHFAAGSYRRVSLLYTFGEFARTHGAEKIQDLPTHADSFAECRRSRGRKRKRNSRILFAKELRGYVLQMLAAATGDRVVRKVPPRAFPFQDRVPGFLDHLVEERGLRPATVKAHAIFLRHFEGYLRRIRLEDLPDLTPAVSSAFVAECAQRFSTATMHVYCGSLRIFLRYLRREGVIDLDLSASVESPQAFRLATLPRSLSWDDVGKVLAAADRRSPVGRRDYAILLLLVTYGLRAREVAALTLDDIDWRAQRLRIPERKGGHSTAFPLSGVVAEALIAYLRGGRPETADRHVFFCAVAPPRAVSNGVVSMVARRRLRDAGISVPKPGSHTLRHTCVQRLVDAEFSFKTIGDYVGHRVPASTAIYGKVAVEALRETALGDGEEVLG